MRRPNGYIISETGNVAAIVTGTARPSKNPKTGPMLQIWILRMDINPIVAVKMGLDSEICLTCPQGPGAKNAGRNRSCYVRTGDAPLAVWKAYKAGRYPHLTLDAIPSVFSGKSVRFGAYGEPVLIPFPVVRAIAAVAANWTGYTHAWRNRLFGAYRAYFMASCDTRQDRQDATDAGWRYFGIGPVIDKAREVICPAVSGKTSCDKCGLCKGSALRAKSVTIPPHGAGARFALQIWDSQATVNA